MPRKGHKSITMPEEDYRFFWDLWEAQRDDLKKRGVRSFSAFVTMKLYEAFALDERST